MRNRLLKTTLATAAAAMLLTLTAFASTRITSVNITSGPDYDSEVVSGTCVSPVFETTSDQYDLSYYETTDSDKSPKTERTYEIRLDARDGYYFDSTNSVSVTVSNVSRIVKKNREDSSTYVIRVKAYPYYQWPAVENITGVDADSSKISWDKGGASKWEYVLEYVDSYGNEKSKHGTLTTNSLSIKSYNKKYTGSNSDRQDAEVTGFAVRAIGNAGSNSRVAAGVWTSVGDADYSDYNDEFSSWSEAVGNAGSTGSATSGSTESGPSGSSNLPSYVVRGSWSNNNGTWSFTDVNGHRYVNEWAAVDNSMYANTAAGQQPFDWFYFDGNGNMYTGWLKDSAGNWYYLQEESNGTRGAMFTGWHWINGKHYQFNDVSDGTRGKCLNPYI